MILEFISLLSYSPEWLCCCCKVYLFIWRIQRERQDTMIAELTAKQEVSGHVKTSTTSEQSFLHIWFMTSEVHRKTSAATVSPWVLMLEIMGCLRGTKWCFQWVQCCFRAERLNTRSYACRMRAWESHLLSGLFYPVMFSTVGGGGGSGSINQQKKYFNPFSSHLFWPNFNPIMRQMAITTGSAQVVFSIENVQWCFSPKFHHENECSCALKC